MRKPPMTFDAIFAALAVLSTTAACSKADRASAEPASAPTVTATSSAAAPGAQPPPPPPAAPTPAPVAADEQQRGPAPKVDAGTERSPAPKPTTKGASAACGATGCSAEMRKGTK